MKTVLLLIGFVLASNHFAEAQPKNIARIGFLSATLPSFLSARADAFQQGLRELGYVEGQNIIIEWRFSEAKLDQLAYNAVELVRLKVSSSSQMVRQQQALPRKQLLRFQS